MECDRGIKEKAMSVAQQSLHHKGSQFRDEVKESGIFDTFLDTH